MMTLHHIVTCGLLGYLLLSCHGEQPTSEGNGSTGRNAGQAGRFSRTTTMASMGGSMAAGGTAASVGGSPASHKGGVSARMGGSSSGLGETTNISGVTATLGGRTAVGRSSGGGRSTFGGSSSGLAGLNSGGVATGAMAASGVASGGLGWGGVVTGGAKAVGGTTAGGGASAFTICTGTPSAGRVVSIYLIGDSTASIYTSDLYPRTGWGQVLGEQFSTACAVVKDKALSGRSSKSFYDEGNWNPIRDGLAVGDFVIIQFGHNDEKAEDATRFTDPQTTFKQYLTTYVNDTKAKKALPILATPIHRNSWSGTKLSDTHGAYPPAMRELAGSLVVPLVDMTALTKAYFDRIGKAETTKLFMVLAAGEFANYPDGNTDNTHLQEKGARAMAQLFTSDAYRQQLAIANNLKAVPVVP